MTLDFVLPVCVPPTEFAIDQKNTDYLIKNVSFKNKLSTYLTK